MDENFQKIRVELKNRLAHVVLNDPPSHYLTHQLMGEMSDALEWLSGQLGTMAVLFSGQGGHFSSGFDYSEHTREIVFSILERFRSVCQYLLNLDFPSIALVDGKVRNWACDLLFFFDYAIAESGATFHFDHLDAGAFSPFACLYLQETVGAKAASQAMMEGACLSAEQAREAGIVGRVAPREELVPALRDLITKIGSRSSAVAGLMLRNARRRKLEIFERFSDEVFADYLNVLSDFEDYNEGIQAWAEKRQPRWSNM